MSIFSIGAKGTIKPKNINCELERLIDTYGNDILRVSYMYLKDKEKSKDAFQEVFIRAYKNWDGFKENCSEKTWLITITMNVCKDFLKSSWYKKVTFIDPSDNVYEKQNLYHNTVEDETFKTIQCENLLDEIMKLPPKYKEVILLYYYEEMGSSEISKILNIPEGTVRSRLFRARKLLKKNMDKEALT